MSSTCIYKEFAIRINAADIGFAEDQYLLVGLVGDSNSFNGNKRVRRWSVYAAGSHANVMANAINASRSCDGGSLRLGNFGDSGYALAETYIAQVRRRLKNAFECVPHKLAGSIQGFAVTVHPKDMNCFSPEESLVSALVTTFTKLEHEFQANIKSEVYSHFTVHGLTD